MKIKRIDLLLLFLVPLGGLTARELSEKEYLQVRTRISSDDINYKAFHLVYKDRFTEAWAPHYRTEVERLLNSLCWRTGVSFEDFDRAHERFSRLGLRYSLELSMYSDTTGKYAREAAVKGSMPLKDRDWFLELSTDLGVDGGDSRLLIEMDSSGNTKLYNIPLSYQDIRHEVAKFLEKDEYGHVHLKCSPEARSAKVFELMTSDMPRIARLNVSQDFTNRGYISCHIDTITTRQDYLDRWKAQKEEWERAKKRKPRMPRGYYDESLPPKQRADTLPDFMFPGIKGIAQIEGSGALYFNLEPVASIDDLIEASRSEYRGVQMVAVDDDVPWGQVSNLLKAVQENRWAYQGPPITIRSSVLSTP